MILLDSSVAIDLLRRRTAAVAWFSQLPGDEDILLPGYVAMELIVGCRNREHRTDVGRLIGMSEVVWINELACDRAMRTLRLIQPHVAIGVLDMLIAETAITLGVPLYTHNVRHFRAVPKLDVIRPFIC